MLKLKEPLYLLVHTSSYDGAQSFITMNRKGVDENKIDLKDWECFEIDNYNCDDENCEACNPYCNECGACGEVGCDGILGFIKHHIEGKTNCKYESSFIEEFINNYNELYKPDLESWGEEEIKV